MQLYTLNPFILRTNILIAGFILTISRCEGYRGVLRSWGKLRFWDASTM